MAARGVGNGSKTKPTAPSQLEGCSAEDCVGDEHLHVDNLSPDVAAPSSLNSAVSTKARGLRKQLGWSLAQAAEAANAHGVGLSSSRLLEMERGKRVWSLRLLEAVAAAYGVPPIVFFESPSAAEGDQDALLSEVRTGDQEEPQGGTIDAYCAQRLNQIRRSQGTLQDAEERIKAQGGTLTSGRISELERGGRAFTLKTLEQISTGLGVPIWEFLPISGGSESRRLLRAWISSGVAGVIKWTAEIIQTVKK